MRHAMHDSTCPIARALRVGVLALLLGPACHAIDEARAEAPEPAPIRTAAAPAPLPARLSETGLIGSGTNALGPELLSFAPQYPLWTDGAEKRRWIWLAPGTFVDASDADAWRFPAGTKLFKEFSFGGRPVETRLMEALPDGTWRFATYLWRPDGSDADLAPAHGVPEGVSVTGGAAPRHAIPSEADCRACHEAGPSAVLGFSALQLSPDRDPNAPHGAPLRAEDVDLAELVERGLVRNLPASAARPRIEAPSPAARAALGTLHGNCGGCHNARGPLAPLGLVLLQSVADPGARAVLDSAVGRPSRFLPPARPSATRRIEPGRSSDSVLALRMGSRDPLVQMPPIGTLAIDSEALALVQRWIDHDLSTGERP